MIEAEHGHDAEHRGRPESGGRDAALGRRVASPPPARRLADITGSRQRGAPCLEPSDPIPLILAHR
jgi:hypothetical protein